MAWSHSSQAFPVEAGNYLGDDIAGATSNQASCHGVGVASSHRQQRLGTRDLACWGARGTTELRELEKFGFSEWAERVEQATSHERPPKTFMKGVHHPG
jgi:hypothetical protein